MPEQRLEKAIEESRSVNQVNSLTEDILSIASQTNLLSLNASIEAARAGEAGKGFAVVASEIGNLANSSADSVAHISKLIDEVRDLVDDAVKQAGNSAEDINESSVLIHSAIDTFENIYANVSLPRAIYKAIAELGWGNSLVKNGKKRKDIGFTPKI